MSALRPDHDEELRVTRLFGWFVLVAMLVLVALGVCIAVGVKAAAAP